MKKVLKYLAGIMIFIICIDIYHSMAGYKVVVDVPLWKIIIGSCTLFAGTFGLYWGGYFKCFRG